MPLDRIPRWADVDLVIRPDSLTQSFQSRALQQGHQQSQVVSESGRGSRPGLLASALTFEYAISTTLVLGALGCRLLGRVLSTWS